MSPLTIGARLRSQVCTTEVIVVRAPSTPADLTCGGRPMLPLTDPSTTPDEPAPGLDTGSLLGKRYTPVGEDSFEVLVTRHGNGTLANGTLPMEIRATKALPSSD